MLHVATDGVEVWMLWTIRVSVNSIVISQGNDNQHPQNKNTLFFNVKGVLDLWTETFYFYMCYIYCKSKIYDLWLKYDW